MELWMWSRAVLLVALLWPDFAVAQGQCGDQDPDCHLNNLDTNLLPCNEVCSNGQSLEVPLFPGNGRLMPVFEALRSYVMGHFRWNKFGKKGGNSSRSMKGGAGPRWEPKGPPTLREGKRSYSMEHFRWGKPMGRKRRPIKVYPNEEPETSAEGLGDQFKRQIPEEAWGPSEPWVPVEQVWGPVEQTWSQGGEAWSPEQAAWGPEEEPEQKKDGKLYKMTHFRWSEGSRDGLRQAGQRYVLPIFPKTPEASQPQGDGNQAEVEGEEKELGPEEKREEYKIGHFRWGSPLKDKRYGGFMNSWDHKPLLTLFRNVMGKEGPGGRALAQ
uniref:Proopiomelanocortin n=1 Tax=Chimaera phantasma TaxID=134990 RepID=Q805B5_9CHON|nr:proopiomelanocortin [Chimaera phantasma]